MSPAASLTQHWRASHINLSCGKLRIPLQMISMLLIYFLEAGLKSRLVRQEGDTEKRKTTSYFLEADIGFLLCALFSSFFLLNREYLIERLQAFIHGNK